MDNVTGGSQGTPAETTSKQELLSSTATPVPAKPLSKDDIRAAILGSAGRYRRTKVSVNGVQVEIRQPSMAAMMAAEAQSTVQNLFLSILLNYAYVPDTDEKVFDDTDEEVLRQLGFSGDVQAVLDAFQEVTKISTKEAEQTFTTSPPGS
jgi:hypothetical protein